GLYDMHGNAWEWCKDPLRQYPTKKEVEDLKGSIEDPVDPKIEDRRVLRGGSWGDDPRFCRSAVRLDDARAHLTYKLGVRVVVRPGERGPYPRHQCEPGFFRPDPRSALPLSLTSSLLHRCLRGRQGQREHRSATAHSLHQLVPPDAFTSSKYETIAL